MPESLAIQPPITALDLAAYAEDVLTPDRMRQVSEFLERHPELSRFADANIATTEVSEELESADDDHAVHIRKAMELPRQPRSRRWWNLKTVTSLALIVAAASWGALNVRSAYARLADVEATVNSGEVSLDSVEGFDLKRILLEMQDSFFLSHAGQRKRAELLGRIYLSEAASHLKQLNVANLKAAPQETDAIQTSELAIQTLRPIAGLSDKARRQLARAYWIKAKTYYMHGIFRPFGGLNEDKVELTTRAALLATQGLQLVWADQDMAANSLKLNLGWLLVKSIRKGANRQPVDSVLKQKIREVFQLPVPDEPVDTLYSVGQQLLAVVPMNTDAEIAYMNLCNAMALCYFGQSKAQELLQQGLAIADQQVDRERRDFRLVLGQLLGNYADSFRYEDRLAEAMDFREQAIAVFRDAAHQDRNNEVIFELGWVTARQLLAEYRRVVEESRESDQLHQLLGALKQITGNFDSLNGLQLGAAEVEMLAAIRAEVDDHPDWVIGAKAMRESVEAATVNQVDYLRNILSLQNHFILKDDPDLKEACRLAQERLQSISVESDSQ